MLCPSGRFHSLRTLQNAQATIAPQVTKVTTTAAYAGSGNSCHLCCENYAAGAAAKVS